MSAEEGAEGQVKGTTEEYSMSKIPSAEAVVRADRRKDVVPPSEHNRAGNCQATERGEGGRVRGVETDTSRDI